jgi:hypothetical protein
MMEVVSYVIYDEGDHTYHQGGGEWAEDRLSAVHYDTQEDAQKDLEDCDQEEILRDRLKVLPEGVELSDPLHLAAVLTEVASERDEQDRQWGGVPHDDANRQWDWLAYLTRHMGKAVKYPPDAKLHIVAFRQQMVKIAAIAVAAIQAADRIIEGDALAQGLRR